MKIELQSKGNQIFAPLKDKWLIQSPEELVRQIYIQRLVNDYGFALDQMKQEVQVNNSQRGQGRASADIVIWKSKKDRQESVSPIIVIGLASKTRTIS